MRREEGAGTALAVAVVAAVLACTVLLAVVGVLLDARRRAAAGADAAALAAADAALGNTTGPPCVRAHELAAANAVELERCEQSGGLVRVTVRTVALGVDVRAVAVAGPPDSGR